MGFIEGGPRRDHQLRRFVVQHGRVDGSMSRKRLYAFKADPLAGEIGKTGVAEPVRGDIRPVHECCQPFLDHMVQGVASDPPGWFPEVPKDGLIWRRPGQFSIFVPAFVNFIRKINAPFL